MLEFNRVQKHLTAISPLTLDTCMIHTYSKVRERLPAQNWFMSIARIAVQRPECDQDRTSNRNVLYRSRDGVVWHTPLLLQLWFATTIVF